jgi:hypothetical protein
VTGGAAVYYLAGGVITPTTENRLKELLDKMQEIVIADEVIPKGVL